ncbi:ankyrin-like protein [Vaccinia virus]|nr:ankyrin-like protein [Vaccinia virus]UIC71976.1 ankyrin-like protein [Vaccinia virus]
MLFYLEEPIRGYVIILIVHPSWNDCATGHILIMLLNWHEQKEEGQHLLYLFIKHNQGYGSYTLNILRYLLDRFDIQKDEYYNTAFQNCNNNVASYIGYDINLPTKDGIRLGV